MMSPGFQKSLLIICSLVFVINANSQQIDSVLEKLRTHYPQEKVYIQYDRSLYSAGETIYGKAYLFTGNEISLISKTFYVDLIDEKGKVLSHKVEPVIETTAAFSFDLPQNISGSYVYVRAYTKWMLNFDSSFLYKKAIPLTNQKKSLLLAKQPLAAVLQFFPEGGDMVIGVRSRVAFKATDQNGLPINISGSVVDSKEKKVTDISCIHDGMGMFSIEPIANDSYQAVWKDESGTFHKTPLPAAKHTGVVFTVENLKDKIGFNISYAATAKEIFPAVIIAAHSQQQLFYRAKANLTRSNSVKSSIPLETVPDGIAQISLFTEDGRPLAQRLVFVNQNNYFFITDLNSSLKDLAKRKKNVLQIDVSDTFRTNLSISVTDADLNPTVSGEEDIFSHVLLTSDIKGYVHNPSYYFSSEADSVAAHLDLVMMTNGWTRFNWEHVLSNRLPVIKHTPENYLQVQGKVTGINNAELYNKDISAVIQLKNKNKQFLSIPVNENGNFFSPELIFYDTAQLFYQFNNDKNKRLTSKANFSFENKFLQAPFYTRPDSSWIPERPGIDSLTLIKNKQLADLVTDSRVKTLATVTIKGRAKTNREKMEEEYTSGMFSGGEGYTYLLDEDPAAASSLNVFNYLQGKIPGLQINNSSGETLLSWRGSPTGVYLNEMPTDVLAIENTPMSDVAMIKVFRPPFMGGFNGAGGAIAVYLKKGASLFGQPKGLDYVNIQGYSPVKEFYSPDYTIPGPKGEADLRKTLYWNPYLVTDKTKRRLQVVFYNNDVSKKYRVVIEGVNGNGQLTRIEKIFQ